MKNTLRRILTAPWRWLKEKRDAALNQSWLDIQTPAFRDRTYHDILTWWERHVHDVRLLQDQGNAVQREQERVKRLYGIDGI